MGTLARAGVVGLRPVLGDGRHAGHDHPSAVHRTQRRRRNIFLGDRGGHHRLPPGPAASSRPAPAPAGRAAGAARAGRQGRSPVLAPPRGGRGRSSASPSSQLALGRPLRRAARGEDRHGRHRRGRRVRGRRVDARGRVGPGRGGSGSLRRRCDEVNAGGRIVVPRHQARCRHQFAQMARLVEDAQNGKAQVERLAGRIGGVFVPIVITLAAATFGFWLGADAGDQRRVHRRRGGPHHRVPCARSVWPRPPHSWWAPAAGPSSESSSRVPRSWSPPAWSTDRARQDRRVTTSRCSSWTSWRPRPRSRPRPPPGRSARGGLRAPRRPCDLRRGA